MKLNLPPLDGGLHYQSPSIYQARHDERRTIAKALREYHAAKLRHGQCIWPAEILELADQLDPKEGGGA